MILFVEEPMLSSSWWFKYEDYSSMQSQTQINDMYLNTFGMKNFYI